MGNDVSAEAAKDSGQDSGPTMIVPPRGRISVPPQPTYNSMSAPHEKDLSLPSPVPSPRAETHEAGRLAPAMSLPALPPQPQHALPVPCVPVAQPFSPGQGMSLVAPAAPPFWAQGAQPGGHIEMEKYCGATTWLIGCLLCPCVCCCPCDQKFVYVAPNGQRIPDPSASCSC